MKLRKYNKKDDFSYVLGISPVSDLLLHHPKLTKKLILSKYLELSLADKLVNLAKEFNITFEFNNLSLERIAYKENTYAAAIIPKFKMYISKSKNHILLVNPSNMGNLGTIIRTCIAFDVKDIAIIRPACDIYDPKVITSSMGAYFQVNIEYFDTIDEYKKTFQNRRLYAFMLGAVKGFDEIDFVHPYTLIFGNEGEGLPESYKSFSEPVKINISKNVDSLNLAVAVAIALQKTYFSSV